MKAYQETTQWDNPETPNHIYLLDGDNLIAYIKQGEVDPFYFKNPIKRFDKRGRKFIEVSEAPFTVTVTSSLRKVDGSKGNSYFVNDSEGTCTCPGFTFRGACKHIESKE
jgi:hypothetical protein